MHKAIDGRVQNAGLFSRVINSTIRNLAITGPLTSVTGDVAGLLAGSVDNSTIALGFANGRVEGETAGGLIGQVDYSASVNDVLVSVEVQGQYVGGLVGNGRSGSLTTTGTLSVRNTLVGEGLFKSSPQVVIVFMQAP